MKFKSKISKEKVINLAGLVGSMEKIGSACVVFLSDLQVRLSIIAIGPDDLQVFAELNQAEFFDEFRIESQSGNCILFEIDCLLLSTALQSVKGSNAYETQIKMAKRSNQPYLVLQTRMLGMSMDVSQDIPIKLMRAEEAHYYTPPVVPVPHVQLEMPIQRSVKTVVDRMKGIDKYIYLDANMRGQLIFRIETESVTIKTFFNHLRPRYESMNGGEENNRENEVTVKVDCKKLASVLHLYGMNFESAIACFVEGISLVTHVMLMPPGSGTATFYQPTMISSIDD